MHCKLYEKPSHILITGILIGLYLALAVILLAQAAKAEVTDDENYPFARVMEIEIVGPRDFAQNVASILLSHGSPLTRPAAISWRKANKAMSRYQGWPPAMIRAKWSQYLTNLYRSHGKPFKTLWIVASSANAAPSEFCENGATLICVQKNECEEVLREYFLEGEK